MKGFSALAGGIVLGMMMIPLVMRTTEEVLQLVPNGYREAALALGIAKWRTIVQIVVRTALKGIVARCVCSRRARGGRNRAIAAVHRVRQPLLYSQPDRPHLRHAAANFRLCDFALLRLAPQAWAGALVLLLLVLFINVGVRVLTRDRFQKGIMNPIMTPGEEKRSPTRRDNMKDESRESLPDAPRSTLGPQL